MTLLQMSFSGAVLILIIILVRMIAINKLPKRTFLALWGIALLRLLFPFSIPFLFSVYSFVNRSSSVRNMIIEGPAANFIPLEPTGKILADGVMTETMQKYPSVSLWFIVWSIGTILCVTFFVISYLRCYFEFQLSSPVSNDLTEKWLSDYPLKRSIAIRQSSRISAPLTYGIFHPVILMPKDTDWENRQQLQYILLHEYIHIRRFDMVWKLIATLTLCIHWFNPMVWIMYKLFNQDIEFVCDECVVRRFGENSKSSYALTLIDMEEKKNGLTSLYNSFSKNAIEERIAAIMKIKKNTLWGLIISMAVLIAIAILFATSAQNPARQLAASIFYLDNKVSFTIPKGDYNWNIQINGRTEVEGFGGMSVHYLSEESESGNWESGKTYSFNLSDGTYTELSIDISLNDEEISINLMEYLPETLKDPVTISPISLAAPASQQDKTLKYHEYVRELLLRDLDATNIELNYSKNETLDSIYITFPDNDIITEEQQQEIRNLLVDLYNIFENQIYFGPFSAPF